LENRPVLKHSPVGRRGVENVNICIPSCFSKISLMKSKENDMVEEGFVTFQPQRTMKVDRKCPATLFVDCMGGNVLYFEHQKHGGGSSVFRLNGDGAV
jgi:hypothetical protein